jgi:cation:H+ antiporter
MLTAALGLAALVRPLPVGRRTRLYAGGSAVAGLLALLALRGGVGRLEGALLLLAYVGLVAAVWVREKEPPGDRRAGRAGRRRRAARPACALAARRRPRADDRRRRGGRRGRHPAGGSTGASDSAIGLTALALATTAELFAIVLAAARHGRRGGRRGGGRRQRRLQRDRHPRRGRRS